ncbi:MAG: endonuclease, partial [Acaryochloridaceae cyanobacterium RL_2_7]|nr:endonuclease [Acaryochloridaceae cyanobacterium RL_2_7]
MILSPPDAVDIQLGLYDLLLKQTYQQALQRLSLIYLRTGEKVTYEVTPEHRQE